MGDPLDPPELKSKTIMVFKISPLLDIVMTKTTSCISRHLGFLYRSPLETSLITPSSSSCSMGTFTYYVITQGRGIGETITDYVDTAMLGV